MSTFGAVPENRLVKITTVHLITYDDVLFI